MSESQKDSSQTKLFLGIIGVLAIIILLLLGWRITKLQFLGVELAPPETPTLTPFATNTSEIPSSIPEMTELTNWAITFSYRFPSGFWSIGTHEYTLENDCPNLKDGSGSWTKTFDVSENAALLSGDVYLRLSGLRDGPLESNSIESINPMQTTTASMSLIEMTRSDAELAFKDCKVTVRWDGTSPQLLTPGLPFER
jgi:hypothetical protein